MARAITTNGAGYGRHSKNDVRDDPHADTAERLMDSHRRFVLQADPPGSQRPTAGGLVAREAERAALVDELDASVVAGRSVVIGGDAGTGKTALLEAFLSIARQRGATVIEGACVEIESRRPFGAFADVLASCLRAFGPERIERSLRERGVELRRLMTRGPNPSALGGTGQERHLMHGSFLGLMEDLAGDGPLVLAVEDLHWADEASLELYGYLSRRMRTRPFLLVATYRTDELGRLHPLRGLFAQLLTARAIHALALAPLDLEGTAALIRTRLTLRDSSASDLRRFRELVHEKCEGNPLHTEETLDVLRQTGRLVYVDGAWTCDVDDLARAIPPTIADSVVARWAALSPIAQRALLIASVAGHRFDLELVSAISGEPLAKIATATREAIDARLVLPESDDDDHLFFRHALTREAISRQLLHWERRELHGKIAALLELRKPTATVTSSELAYHFDQSGQKEPASRYHEEAAEEAAGALAFASAARHLERAIELGSDEGAGGAPQHVRLSRYLYLSGDNARSVRAASAAIERAERSGDAVTLGEALQVLWRYHHWRGELELRDQMSARAVQVLEPLGPTPQLARVLVGQCWAAFERGQGAEVVRLAERALAIVDNVGLVAERAMPLNSLCTGLFLLGRFDEAVAAGRSGLAVALRAGLVDEAHWLMVSLRITLCATSAPIAEQRRLRDEHRAFMRQHGLAVQHFVSWELAERLNDGDWDGFLSLLREFEAEALPVAFAEAQVAAVFVNTARSGPESVPELDVVREGIRADALTGEGAFWSAALLLLAGRPAEAVRFARGVHKEAVRLRRTSLTPAARAHAIGLFAAQRSGDGEALDRFERSLLEVNSPPALPVADEIHHALAKASVAERRGQIADAIKAYGEALEACDRARYGSGGGMVPYLISLTRLRAAELELLDPTTNKARAQADLEALLPFWRRAKATWYLAQLRDWALANGLSFPEEESPDVPVHRSTKTLTQREREVALLVAQGLTNREIAKRLSLSVRTAESHVEQIRSKLGFHARSQIATWVTGRYGARPN